jgi:hypothetical protein
VQPGEVFAAGLALMIISYNNFPQRTLEQKCRFLLRRTGRCGAKSGLEMSGLKNRTN